MMNWWFSVGVWPEQAARSAWAGLLVCAAMVCGPLAPAWAQAPAAPVAVQEKAVYRCPGNLYTDAITAREAAAKGCKTLEGAPITVIQSPVRPPPRPATPGNATSNASGGGASGGERVSPQDQRARDADARRILEAELRKEEDALAALQKEYNNGQPERRGDERNYQKYIDRVSEMKNAITRKEADVASIRRELAKLGVAAAPAPSSPANPAPSANFANAANAAK